MEYQQHVEAVRRETDALIAAFGSGGVDDPVPTCPEWMIRDLARHVGEFTGFWTHAVCEGAGREKTPFPDMPERGSGGVAQWYRGLADSMIEVLSSTPPDTEIWTWVESDDRATFAARRAAHELAVHRYDAQNAVGTAQPIDAPLAADGVEEIFVMMSAWEAKGHGTGQTLHLHATDQEAEWLITLLPDRIEVEREHAKGDLALKGTTSDLELTLYQRPPLGEVERFGDESVLDAWHAEFTFT